MGSVVKARIYLPLAADARKFASSMVEGKNSAAELAFPRTACVSFATNSCKQIITASPLRIMTSNRSNFIRGFALGLINRYDGPRPTGNEIQTHDGCYRRDLCNSHSGQNRLDPMLTLHVLAD